MENVLRLKKKLNYSIVYCSLFTLGFKHTSHGYKDSYILIESVRKQEVRRRLAVTTTSQAMSPPSVVPRIGGRGRLHEP